MTNEKIRCLSCKSENMVDLSSEECEELTEEDYKSLNIDIEEDVITRFKGCNDCGLIHSISTVRRNKYQIDIVNENQIKIVKER